MFGRFRPFLADLAFMLAIFAAPYARADDDPEPAAKPLSRSTESNVPLYQLEPFDRLEVKNDKHTKIDVEPDRIPKDVDAKFPDAEVNTYCGVPGLPQPGVSFRKDVWYRFRSASDTLKYEVFGKGIALIELYEDVIYSELMKELAKDVAKPTEIKFDDCNEYLRILFEREPESHRLFFARIRFHAAEARASEFRQDWQRAFWSLNEERQLRMRMPANVKVPNEVRDLAPLEQRFGEVADHWATLMVNTRKFEEGRRAVARLEAFYPNSPVAAKWRREYDRRVQQILLVAGRQETNRFFVEALTTLEAAVDIQPDHPGLRAMTERIYAQHARLRVAVGQLPSYRGGPAAWSPADYRAADLLHEPLMRLRATKEGVSEFDSRIVDGFTSTDLNRKALIEVRPGLVWPGDGKAVTPVDVQRLFADSRQRTGTLYHPALEFLLTNIQARPPSQMELDFDRPQFQARAWLQIPFLRIGRDPSATSATATVGWSGLGPFRVRERRADRALYLANGKFLDAGKPLVKQVVELRYAAIEDRLRALENGDVDMVDFVPFRNLPYSTSIPNAKMVRESTAKVHVLHFNLRKAELRNPQLRRAIAYVLDREAICKRVGVTLDNDNRLLAGPLPFGAFGANEQVKAWPYEPKLGRAIIGLVKRELKSVAPLVLAHQGNESTRMACDEIAKQLTAAGLPVTVMEIDERSPDPREADLRYQTFTVTDPIYDVVTLLTRDNPSLFNFAGPRLRQLLIDLLQVPNATVAGKLLPELQEALHDDVALVPLWQWHDSFLVSDAVRGVAAAPPKFYHGVGGWTTTPRYPPAVWETKALAGVGSSTTKDIVRASSREEDRR